jgi:uncharacterized protein (TIGR00661 family)
MNKIFYGLAGEGLGHASRTLAVVDALPDLEVHLFTFGKAFDFLKDMGYPYLHKIKGLMFPYKNGKVDYPRLAYRTIAHFCKGITENIEYIAEQNELLKPKLFISDFEPSIPRAAKICDKHLISIDNQHRFAYTDLIELPLFLRMYGWGCGLAAKFMVPSPNHTIISTFHFDHIKPKGNVVLANGLFRNNVIDQQPNNGDYLLVYIRESVNDAFMRSLRDIRDFEVRIYGARDGYLKQSVQRRSNFKFFPLSSEFVKDLAGCNRLMTTAGNQLISEARYFGKYCLVVPEPGQYEQSINAFYVEKIGMGIKCEASNLTKNVILDFMKISHNQNSLMVPNGVNKVTEVVRNCLNNAH